MSLSIAELKSRVKELGLEVPPDVIEKSDLLAFVEKAERNQVYSQGIPCSPGASGPTPSVAELKGRLRELGFEIPSNIVEKSELLALVEEAERHRARANIPPPSPKVRTRTGGDIPPPWYQKESRSKPGKFYYVNSETGETVWDLPKSTNPKANYSGAPASDILKNYKPDLPTEVERTDLSHKQAEEVPPPPAEEYEEDDANVRTLLPNEMCKLDYRDDAFCDTQDDSLPVGRSMSRPWSRQSTMSCTEGTSGVKSLSLTASTREDQGPAAPPSAPSAPSGTPVQGSRYLWMRGEMIGRGSLGRVFKALDQLTGQILAVKEVQINVQDESDRSFMDSLKNEVKIMQDLRHPHIVSYLGHDFADGCLYMFLEHMPGGTLTQALQQFGPFEESLIAAYSKQLLDGLEYMHTRSPPVVHRDIKGSNILVGADCRVKLADFGCSKRTQETMTQTMRGSIPWMAPEVIAHSRYGRAADIWSFGCVGIEMGTARVPWGRFENQMAALVRIGMSDEMPTLPKGLSDMAMDFICQCVRRDPGQRPSTTELLNHELVRDILPLDD